MCQKIIRIVPVLAYGIFLHYNLYELFKNTSKKSIKL
jgi:hypothetical protein